MTSYTKDSIEKLLDKYMSGTSTLDEEDLLARYFRESNVPEEWKNYQLLFQEIEAMKTSRPQKSSMLWWTLAAAVVLGIIFVAVPKRSAEPITAQADTTAVRQELVPFIEQQIPAIEQETPATEKKSGTSTIEKENVRPMPKQKRSLRKSEPTIHDYAKAYALMAEAVQEQQEAEQKVAESRMTTLQAQLEALGYKSVRHEDGTIEYIDKNIHYTAYEE